MNKMTINKFKCIIKNYSDKQNKYYNVRIRCYFTTRPVKGGRVFSFTG